MEMTGPEALKKTKYGKGAFGDTLELDAIMEIIMSKRLEDFNRDALLITEELGKSVKSRLSADPEAAKQEPIFIADPTDRSKFLAYFLKKIPTKDSQTPIGDYLKNLKNIKRWEKIIDRPVSITGSTSAITCIRKGAIAFSVILNYISRYIFLAADNVVAYIQLPVYSDPKLEKINFDYIVKNGKPLLFPSVKTTCHSADDFKKFVTFLGKTGYQKNFDDSQIFSRGNDFLHHNEPGGPARILYLSELQKGYGPIGFILANGEKIIEWIHWLSFIKFAGNSPLRAYEIAIERPWTKDGVLMSTSRPYSLFCCEGGSTFIDVSRLRNFSNPSKFRSTIVVTHADNERIIYTMTKHNYRDITEYL